MMFDDTDCVQNPEGGFYTNAAIFFWRSVGQVIPGTQNSLEERDIAWPGEKAQTALLWGLGAYFLREQEEGERELPLLGTVFVGTVPESISFFILALADLIKYPDHFLER